KIKLGKGEQIDEPGFKKTSTSHRVSEDEAQKWWPDWKELWRYPVEVIEMFKKTKSVKIPRGVQKFVSNVEFLNEEYLEPINVQEGEYLAPDGK
ncbi:hypothetical protein LCGC14_2847920, partial [marine sediment metagenome]